MAVTFSKSGTNNLSVFWDSNDLEVCGASDYRYIYQLFRDGNLFQSDGPTLEVGWSWSNLPEGTYNCTVVSQYEAFGPGSGFSQCSSYFSGNIVIDVPAPVFCIPIDATNMSMKNIAKFYGVDADNILLSGPNNPSTPGSLFGNSDLPNTGSPSKTTPNAISELRGRCGGFYDWSIAITNPTPVRIIIVGNSGTILTSTNGTTWAATTAPNTAEALLGVSTGDSFRFAVGNNGVLIKTKEGVFWNRKTSGTSFGLIDCDRLLGGITANLFVGVSGTIRYSDNPNLDTWAIRPSGTTENLQCVRFINQFNMRALIVGSGGVILRTGNINYDAWEARPSGTTQFLLAIGLNTFTGVTMVAGGGGVVRTSSDQGVTWVNRNISTSETIRGLSFGRLGTINRWVAVGGNGIIFTSDNEGVNWTQRTSGTTIQFNKVVYDFSIGLYIAVGQSGMIKTSSDGITWTARTSNTTQNLNDVKIYDEGIF